MTAQAKSLIFIFVFLLSLPIITIIYDRVGEDQSAENSSAIFGGRLERDYPSAGYMIAYVNDTTASICGLVKLDTGLAITAAHCMTDVAKVYLSADPTEPQIVLNAVPVDIFTKAGWDGTNSKYDFSVLQFDEEERSTAVANVATPKIGCDYRLVGYGRTEDDNGVLGINREKRSTALCINSYDDNLLYIEGDGGGICLGDSGSPIYEEGTHNVVGIISSVVVKNGSDPENPCYIGNEGVAVRVDKNLSFVASVVNDGGIDPNPSDPNDVIRAGIADAVDEEIQAGSNGTDEIFKTVAGEDKKLLGVDAQLLTSIYLLVIVLYLLFVIKTVAFSKKKSPQMPYGQNMYGV